MRYHRQGKGLGRRGVTVTGDLVEFAIFAVLVIIGILLLVLGASYNKNKAQQWQDDRTAYVVTIRAQMNELLMPFAAGIPRTVADEIILAQVSEDIKDEWERSPCVTLRIDDEAPGRIFLPTLDGKVISVGGYYKMGAATLNDKPC